MARVVIADDLGEELRKRLLRSFQSGHINFLLGSGASRPAICTAGQIEAEIAELISRGVDEKACAKMYAFLESVHIQTNKLINGEEDDSNSATLACYESLLRSLEAILLARRTTILPRQATVFTTNYDLFIEKASAACPATILNDGFSRPPSLGYRMEYSSRNFFRATYNTGNLYEYKVEVPCINLVKLHGSLSWTKDQGDILLRVEAMDLLNDDATHEDKLRFISTCAVVLPQAAKFRETLMDRTYYDLLRIYANTLDRENTVLLVFGFSFGDEHIRDITMRALKNPTLRIMIFAFDAAAREGFQAMFQQYSNVDIVVQGDDQDLQFEHFNSCLSSIFHADQR